MEDVRIGAGGQRQQLSAGAEIQQPLAITVISGLLFSTFITLVVIPSAYMLVPSRIEPDTAAPRQEETA